MVVMTGAGISTGIIVIHIIHNLKNQLYQLAPLGPKAEPAIATEHYFQFLQAKLVATYMWGVTFVWVFTIKQNFLIVMHLRSCLATFGRPQLPISKPTPGLLMI